LTPESLPLFFKPQFQLLVYFRAIQDNKTVRRYVVQKDASSTSIRPAFGYALFHNSFSQLAWGYIAIENTSDGVKPQDTWRIPMGSTHQKGPAG
jgi:hypothetical protein